MVAFEERSQAGPRRLLHGCFGVDCRSFCAFSLGGRESSEFRKGEERHGLLQVTEKFRVLSPSRSQLGRGKFKSFGNFAVSNQLDESLKV